MNDAKILIPVLMVLVMLSVGCAKKPEPTGNKAHDTLVGLSEREQMSFLGKAFIEDEPCTVNRVFYAGMSKERTAFWDVGCTNSKSYQIRIMDDEQGTMGCVECAFLKQMTHLDCFVKLSAQK
jgi:hypothetical protein